MPDMIDGREVRVEVRGGPLDVERAAEMLVWIVMRKYGGADGLRRRVQEMREAKREAGRPTSAGKIRQDCRAYPARPEAVTGDKREEERHAIRLDGGAAARGH